MKALLLYGPRDLRLEERPIPHPRPHEVLLHVRAVTVCHSDIHYYRYGRIGDTVGNEPFILGHEFAGEIVEVGSAVQHLQPGMLVAVEPALSCGHCRYCQEGNPNLCENLRFAGSPEQDGALQEYLCWPAEFLHPLPKDFDADEGALLEPLGVAIHAWDLGKLRIGQSVAIVGCGPIGLLLIQLALVGGASQVFAIEPLAYRRALAEEWGAIPLEPGEGLAEQITGQTNGYGVDVAIEAAGVLAAQEEAARIVKRGGRVVLVGIPPEDQLLLTHHLVRRKGLTIKLSRRMKLVYPRAITLVQRGMVNLRPLLTHTFSLEEGRAAFELVEQYADGVIKASFHL